jgi:hypothetical protein
MNGTDWPSPDANLSKVEEKLKKIIATTGVDFPNIASGSFYHFMLIRMCLALHILTVL